MSEPTVTLVIRSEGRHPSPFPIRLRMALKVLLRRFGLRVVEIKPQPEESECSSN